MNVILIKDIIVLSITIYYVGDRFSCRYLIIFKKDVSRAESRREKKTRNKRNYLCYYYGQEEEVMIE